LSYASKEKFYTRITKDPDLLNPIGISLPRMAFEMNGITYDVLRKRSSFVDDYDYNTPTGLRVVKTTPYNFDFNVYIFVRNTEDGMQLVEQILPYFNPDYTITIDFISMNGMKLDVPVVFNSISYDDSHEGDPESTRSIIWTLNFTAKAFLFGHISDGKTIRKATANVYDSTFETNPIKDLVLNSGTISYKVGELIYQGREVEESYASGYVRNWTATTNTLSVIDSRGTFTPNNTVHGAVTGAEWNLESFSINTNQLVEITVEPNPVNANANDDFGFTTTIQEFI
jgi:hypothetical protein